MFNPEASATFNLHENDTGRPFYEMQISYQPAELRPLIQDVISQERPLNLTNVLRTLPDGREKYADIHITPLMDCARKLIAVAVSFTDVTQYRELQKEAEKANIELEQAYEELQSTSEELETANEELQSTVEELKTANEGLQSSNEEMETMNEKLLAANEELQTINDELREQTEELNHTNASRDSILSSAHRGIIVRDRS